MGNSTTKTHAQPSTKESTCMSDGSDKIICNLFPNYLLVFSTLNHDDEKLKVPDKEKVYNFKNLSILEEYLPDEIIIYILQYLPMKCVLKLGRVSKNFYNYWIEFPQLWNNNSDLCTMLYLPQRYENNHRKNLLFFHNEFKPKIVNAFQYKSSNNGAPFVVKFVLVGSQKCGKSVLADRVFKDIPYEDNYVSTIGVEFRSKFLQLSEEERYGVQVWDTAGDVRFRSFIMSFFKGAKGFYYCFDLSDHSSFETARSIFEDWKSHNGIEKVYEYLESNDACLILLGLKSDLPHMVTQDEIFNFLETVIGISTDKYLHHHRIQYFELSTKKDSLQDLIFPFAYACTILNKPHFFSTPKVCH
ncbi:hypothetical protein C9374_009431 [Naegleria lovaniensis]|uniref:F-box domain-containing protein n=1 Tax=Naegleria lovaniensis TaxID=51637 RepID=A0AA88H3A0_NAELO|nr:uncharacterized protein C9374_009431 [Naegleria lovaniensis]KAG2392854.1 hypothetical protein C9374_009431 [Naegleria lovaniensis]